MQILYDNTKVNYITLGEGTEYVVFLHGWSGSIESFLYVAKNLNLNKKFLLIDFPPFGKSDEPSSVWGVEDYALALKAVVDAEKIENFDIISHSFGGRVAIYFSSVYTERVNSLVLVDSAGLKPRRGIRYHFKVLSYKILKKLGFKFARAGSEDYQKLSPHMKKVFVKVINEDLSPNCRQILAKTLIVFGDKDKDTPLYMAKKLKKLIPNSELIILKDAGHFSYLDNFYEFKTIIENFIGG